MLVVLLAAAAVQTTSLRIVEWPADGTVARATLRCAPAGGTLPHAAAACRRLAAIPHPFAPTPAGVACAEIYGGPEKAHVVGVYRGRRIDTWFQRRDSCETARWDRVRFLFPVAAGA
jgi:hypothetical protein